MESTELLINEVKKYTMLYNIYSTGYRNYEKKRRIWEIIANRVGEPETSCRSKWSRLRDSYLKCLRRIVEEPNWVCKWPYFNKMRFLDDVDLLDKKATNKEFYAEELTMILIQRVKHHELLYNRCHIDYRDQERRNEAWEDIASQLNASVDKCKKRWRSLRDRYFVLTNSYKTGTPTWAFFEQLSFLDAHRNEDGQQCDEDTTTETFATDDENVFFEKLIEEVKKHRVLYDTSYASTEPDEKTQLWKNIAHKLKKTVEECKEQFNILAKIYYDMNSGTVENKSKQWKLYNKLKFLDNMLQSYSNEADIERSLQDLIEEVDSCHDDSNTEYCMQSKAGKPISNTSVTGYLNEEDYNALIEEIGETNDATTNDSRDEVAINVEPTIRHNEDNEEQKVLGYHFDSFVDNTLEKLNTLSDKQKRQRETQKDSITLLFAALARSVQESQLPQHKLLELHNEVSAFVLKNLMKYVLIKNKNS